MSDQSVKRLGWRAMNHRARGRSHWLEPRKLLISVLLGLGGFAGSFFTLSFSLPPFSIAINWSDFLPLLAAMAYGGRYGFMAATLGLGALYPFFLWPSNGWACLVTSLLLIYWVTVNGFFMERRRRRPDFWNHPHLIYPASILVFNILVLALFPLAMRFNPPFWNPAAELSMSTSFLITLIVKGFVVLYVVALLVDLLLKLPLVRRTLGLEIAMESRFNGRVALFAIGGSLAIWCLLIILDRILLLPASLWDFTRFRDSDEIIALLTSTAAGVVIGSALVSYQEARRKAEDALFISQERLRLAISAADIGIWDWHIYDDHLSWDRGMGPAGGVEGAGGVERAGEADLGGSLEAWRGALHPDDLPIFDEELQAALRGEREFAPVVRMSGPDGEFRSIKVHSRMIRDESGEASRLIGVTIDITERIRTEERIKRSLEEKVVLLRELHHRTKNNMAVISALLNMQAESAHEDALRVAYAEMQARIDSMALVHQKLYEAQDLSRVNMTAYVTDLLELIRTSYRVSSVGLAVEREAEDLSVSIDAAIPCGLILTELITNALKHAFPADRPGEIRCRLQRLESGELLIRVADNGRGFPSGFNPRTDGKMGLQTIRSLGEEQLRGTVDFISREGLTCEFRFRDDLHRKRI